MSNENTDYEKFVRGITQALLRAQGLETVTVQHDVQVAGRSRSHQVDVYWEYRLGGVLHRVVVNCKRYASTVAVTDVLTLGGVLADMPGVRGLIVTTVGFQKGAIDYARDHQIGLKIVRPPEDSDWEGRIRSWNVQLRLATPRLTSCTIQLNDQWVDANLPERQRGTAEKMEHDAATMTVRDVTNGSVNDMNALFNRAIGENPIKGKNERRGVLKWDNAFLERPGQPPMRVDAIEFRWVVEGGEPLNFTWRSEPAAIVRDAIAGTLLFIDPDGEVTGDIEKELGVKRRR